MKIITIKAAVDTGHPAYYEPKNFHELLDVMSRFIVTKDALWEIRDVPVKPLE